MSAPRIITLALSCRDGANRYRQRFCEHLAKVVALACFMGNSPCEQAAKVHVPLRWLGKRYDREFVIQADSDGGAPVAVARS